MPSIYLKSHLEPRRSYVKLDKLTHRSPYVMTCQYIINNVLLIAKKDGKDISERLFFLCFVFCEEKKGDEDKGGGGADICLCFIR